MLKTLGHFAVRLGHFPGGFRVDPGWIPGGQSPAGGLGPFAVRFLYFKSNLIFVFCNAIQYFLYNRV